MFHEEVGDFSAFFWKPYNVVYIGHYTSEDAYLEANYIRDIYKQLPRPHYA